MTIPEPQLPFGEPGSLGIGRYLLTGSAFVVAFSAGDVVDSPEVTFPGGLGPVLVGVTLPFDAPGEASTVSQVEVDLDRGFKVSFEESQRRVLALRTWVASLPAVPSIPADAFDRSELY